MSDPQQTPSPAAEPAGSASPSTRILQPGEGIRPLVAVLAGILALVFAASQPFLSNRIGLAPVAGYMPFIPMTLIALATVLSFWRPWFALVAGLAVAAGAGLALNLGWDRLAWIPSRYQPWCLLAPLVLGFGAGLGAFLSGAHSSRADSSRADSSRADSSTKSSLKAWYERNHRLVAWGVLGTVFLAGITALTRTAFADQSWLLRATVVGSCFLAAGLVLALGCLRRREIVLVGILLFVACGVRNVAEGWANTLFARQAMAQDSNLSAVAKEFPPALSVPAPGESPAADQAYKRMRRGGNELADLPLGVLITPLLHSGLIIALGLILVVAVIAFTSRQWTHHERLQHPLAQVPLAVSDRSILGDRGFQVALVLVLALWFWNLFQGWGLNPLPKIPIEFEFKDAWKLLGMDQDPGNRFVFTSFWVKILLKPMVIGVAFLLTLELGFSVWSGFWFGCIIFGWLYAMGQPVSFSQDARSLGAGAMIAMACVIAWIGRHHYGALLQAACGLGNGAGDRMGVWAARVLVLTALALMTMLAWHGGSLWAGVIGILLLLIYIVNVARVVAESGLPIFQTATDLTPLLLSLGLPMVLPYRVLLMLSYLGSTMVVDTRENMSGFSAQAAGMAERQRLPTGRLLVGAGVLVVLAALVTVLVVTAVNWTGEKEVVLGFGRGDQMQEQATKAAQDPDGPGAAFAKMILKGPVLVGFVLLFVVVGLRRLWTGFIFHPLGLVVAASFPVWQLWGSLAVGWAAKFAVVRYGGPGLYTRLKPVAFGLILGDLLGMFLQFIVIGLGKLGGYELETWIKY